MNTAQTILSQIKAIDPMALFAWGAVDLKNTGEGLMFKTSGMTPFKGSVYIKYNEGLDLYEIQFLRTQSTVAEKVEKEVYAEDLVRIIDGFVG